MRIVLDASVAVAAVRANEPAHRAARDRVEAVLTGVDDLAVPAIFTIEVAALLARAGWSRAEVERYLASLAARTAEHATIGARRAPRIRAVAIATRLRAADAAYVWLASARQVPLVTLDAEVMTRAASLCVVEPP